MNYYNEHDPKTAAWIRELIKGGHIAPGVVDERDIQNITATDLVGFTQCHFFAGIGGWSEALRLAGWSDERPVWTGSCPCQPFSSAGKQKGNDDERHLWPAFFELIRKCRPECVLGEQVASAIGHGWLDGISADLELEGYACGAVVLGAHSLGAPHVRQRLYWVADSASERRKRLEGSTEQAGRALAEERGAVGGLVQPFGAGLEGHTRDGDNRGEPRRLETLPHGSTATSSGWSDFYIVPCADGKSRRVESGLQPLAHGVSGRVGLLRGYGNAIVPQVAAEFISAYLDPNQ